MLYDHIVCLQSQVQELQVQHSTTGRSVPTLPAEHTPVQYATIAPVLTPPVNVSLA